MYKVLTAVFFIVLCFTKLQTTAQSKTLMDSLLPVRGLALGAPNTQNLDSFILFIDKELVPNKINTIILRIDYHYQYTSHPEMIEYPALSKAEVQKILAVTQKNGIKIIPQINLLGHQSWAGHTGKLLTVYPQFDETPWIKMPENYEWPNADGLYCKSYCPLHPDVHSIVFDMVDEICDVFETDAFHAGMDEVFYIGEEKCPRCGGRDKAELFAGEVRSIHDHLATKGRRLWIWGDRLLDGKTTGLGMWEASFNHTHRAIDMIPKSIVICDWHYDRPDKTAVYFAMKGFDVVSCPWKEPESATQQVKDMVAFRQHSARVMSRHFMGFVATIWSSTTTFIDEYYTKPGSKKNNENTSSDPLAQAKTLKAIFAQMAKIEKENKATY